MIGRVKMRTNLSALKVLQKKSPVAFQKAMEKGGIQFLTWANTGSAGSKESRKPPIRYGVLRGSSSVFVGSKLVQVYPQTIRSGADERPSPAKSHSANPTTMTFVWNTDYATKMHEWKGTWGKFTEQDGDAGNKWVEKHLQSDKDLLMKIIADDVKKGLGL